jgi:hypothetical protein
MTLQEQYNLIKEGKGAKDVFTKHAKSLFPHLVPNHYGFDNASQILTQRGIISENLWGITTGNNNQQPDWFSIFNESLEIDTKADAKKPAKEVEEYEEKSYDSQYGAETGDDVIFDQYINGIQIETCNPKNANKTVDELKKMVLKNLKKDKLYYTKNAAFGVEGIGYTDEAPGLGKTKEVKGKYASSGMEPVKLKEDIGMFMDPIGYDKGSKSQIEKARDILKDAGLSKEEIETFISNNMFKKGRLDDLAQEFIKNNLEENMNIQESKLRSAIRSLIKEELNLKEIDQIGEEAQKMAKSKKIDDEVNKRKKKLKALETLKELEADSVNPGKIKELYKEIKTLEKLKEKLNKTKGKKEQIIDEETYVGTSALDDLKKDPKFGSLRSDAKASAEDELKKGGSVTVENKIPTGMLKRIDKNKSLKVGDVTTLMSGKLKGKKVEIVKDLGDGQYEVQLVKE